MGCQGRFKGSQGVLRGLRDASRSHGVPGKFQMVSMVSGVLGVFRRVQGCYIGDPSRGSSSGFRGGPGGLRGGGFGGLHGNSRGSLGRFNGFAPRGSQGHFSGFREYFT